MQLFNRGKPAALGVDIGASSVKVVELARGREAPELRAYAVIELPITEAGNLKEARIEVVGNAIKKAIRKTGTRLTHAVAAVPSSVVITKSFEFPASLSEEDIAAQVELEAEHAIPYPLNEVSLDFVTLGRSSRHTDMQEVLVVAARKEHVEDRAAAIEWAGLKSEVIDFEPFAMEEVCSRLIGQLSGSEPGSTLSIVDVAANETTLYVVRHGQVIFTREQNFGGRQLSEEIQKRYGLSFEDAERAKRQGGLPDNYVAEIQEPFVATLCQQISRSLHFFRSSQPQHTIEQLILVGGGASTPGLETQLEQIGEPPVIVANPFLEMAIDRRVNAHTLSIDAPAMVVATGLALQSLGE